MQTGNEHDFQKPPPGQGALSVCAKCGERKTDISQYQQCDGPHHVTEPVNAEYDPYK